MFARSTALRLKPNCLVAFTRTFQEEVLPILMQEVGFQEEITFPTSATCEVTHGSQWRSPGIGLGCDYLEHSSGGQRCRLMVMLC
jgi:hypothetical protein